MLEALVAASKALNAGEVVQCPLLLSFELLREHQIYRERGEDDCLRHVDPRGRKAQTNPIAINEAAHDPNKEAAASAAVVIRIMLRDGLRDLGRRVVVRNVEVSTYCGYQSVFKKSQITIFVHKNHLVSHVVKLSPGMVLAWVDAYRGKRFNASHARNKGTVSVPCLAAVYGRE